MSENEHKENIKQIQNALRVIYKNGGDIPEIKADGIYGSETAEAVRTFQKNTEIEETGEVDYQTWKRIMDEARKGLGKISPPLPITPFVSDEQSKAAPGEHNWAVYFAQLMLNVISVRYTGYDDVEINGTNSGATTEAFRQIQLAGNITDGDGTLDKRTWNTIASVFEFSI